MLLALSVLGPQAVDLGSTAYKVFDQPGGSIGRLDGNDWTLPDPEKFVSMRHASVAFSDGAWLLADLSTNGTFINRPDQPVGREQPVQLQDGDRIFIGNYEILVQLIDTDAPQRDPSATAPLRARPEFARSASAGPADLFLALGIDPARASEDTYRMVGTIMRTVVQGLVEVLQARAQVKSQFRVSMTNIKPVENNPLKFARTADEALQCLFGTENPGYLGPEDAFREAFEDVARHQVAVLAGVRAAYDNTLAGFHPERLEAQYERWLRRASFFRLFGRLRYWSLYRAHFEELEADPETHFQRLFGEEFAKAYADQLQSLQAAKRAARQVRT